MQAPTTPALWADYRAWLVFVAVVFVAALAGWLVVLDWLAA